MDEGNSWALLWANHAATWGFMGNGGCLLVMIGSDKDLLKVPGRIQGHRWGLMGSDEDLWGLHCVDLEEGWSILGINVPPPPPPSPPPPPPPPRDDGSPHPRGWGGHHTTVTRILVYPPKMVPVISC